jgi:monoamine oxidase
MTVTPDRLRELAGDPAPAPVGREHILVLGAGMAGLAAAFELRRRGFAVTILEAQPRVGGRIQTFREPFSDGLYGEAGAMRIPRAHDLVLRYVERFGLPTVPFVMENPAHLRRLRRRTDPPRRLRFGRPRRRLRTPARRNRPPHRRPLGA